MTITLYTLGTPNGVKISVALHVLGLKYITKVLDVSTNVQKEPWFLKINPNGRIPAITEKSDTDGTETNVFESGAILMYLADKHDKDHKISYPYGSKLYYETIQWLFFQNAGVGPMQGQAHHFKIFAPKNGHVIPYGVERYVGETRRLYSVLETRLKNSGTGYLVGDHISIADIAHIGWVGLSDLLEIDLQTEFPLVYKWLNTLVSVPGVADGLNVPTKWTAFARGWIKEPST